MHVGGSSAEPPADLCPTCGRQLDAHNRHVRFQLPDPVLDVPAEEREARTWGNDVMTQVDGVGAFVRSLLPVRLSGGHTLTYGLWLSVHPDDHPHHTPYLHSSSDDVLSAVLHDEWPHDLVLNALPERLR